MNKTVLRGWIWCKRFRKRCGYGVHSPSDFFFITFVIYEKLPFYAYSQLHHLRRLVAHLSGHREKVDKLFFRLVNFLRPKTIIEFGTGSGMSTRYMSEANNEMCIYTYSDGELETQVERLLTTKKNIYYLGSSEKNKIDYILQSHETPVLYHIAHTSDYKEVYEKIISNVSDGDCLVISYPYKDKNKKLWWQTVVKDDRTGVTFDLYDIGIVFFDKKRVKENRIVNFI